MTQLCLQLLPTFQLVVYNERVTTLATGEGEGVGPPFLLLVAGSRSFETMPQQEMNSILTKCASALGVKGCTVVNGDARGVDKMATKWAQFRGFRVRKFRADWDSYGKAAGFVRNKAMVHIADAAIVVWDGESKGTKHTMNLLHEKQVPYVVVVLPQLL